MKIHILLQNISALLVDKTVLLVGYGPSAVDISIGIMAVARRVVVSYHSDPKKVQFLQPGIELRPNIRRFGENEVEFVDGSTDEFTDVVFCTGRERYGCE